MLPTAALSAWSKFRLLPIAVGPALLTSRVGAPRVSTVCCIAAVTAPASATSATIGAMDEPYSPARSTVRFAPSALMSHAATFMPCWAARMQADWPIPLPAPVTMATVPSGWTQPGQVTGVSGVLVDIVQLQSLVVPEMTCRWGMALRTAQHRRGRWRPGPRRVGRGPGQQLPVGYEPAGADRSEGDGWVMMVRRDSSTPCSPAVIAKMFGTETNGITGMSVMFRLAILT